MLAVALEALTSEPGRDQSSCKWGARTHVRAVTEVHAAPPMVTVRGTVESPKFVPEMTTLEREKRDE